jgi:pimeloyl-ACP methyl ester carboxylesterase
LAVVVDPSRVPADAAIHMARTTADAPDFSRHLRKTTRSRFSDGRWITMPVTIAWGEKERLVPGPRPPAKSAAAHHAMATAPGLRAHPVLGRTGANRLHHPRDHEPLEYGITALGARDRRSESLDVR